MHRQDCKIPNTQIQTHEHKSPSKQKGKVDRAYPQIQKHKKEKRVSAENSLQIWISVEKIKEMGRVSTVQAKLSCVVRFLKGIAGPRGGRAERRWTRPHDALSGRRVVGAVQPRLEAKFRQREADDRLVWRWHKASGEKDRSASSVLGWCRHEAVAETWC